MSHDLEVGNVAVEFAKGGGGLRMRLLRCCGIVRFDARGGVGGGFPGRTWRCFLGFVIGGLGGFLEREGDVSWGKADGRSGVFLGLYLAFSGVGCSFRWIDMCEVAGGEGSIGGRCRGL